MERWKGRTALVTGASAGIGYAIADALARNGMKVIGCARKTEKILELGKKHENGPGSVEAVQCDVSKPEQITAMFEHIEKKYKHVDVLVNNAGIVKMEPLLTGRTDKWRELLEVNILGLCECAREAVRLMQKYGVTDGNIININSLVGHMQINMPAVHFYTGSKQMVTSLTESLHREVRAMEPKNNIRITDVSPGVVDTEIGERAAADAQNTEPFSPGDDYQHLNGNDIAESVVYVLSAPQHVNIKTLIICPTQQPVL